ncbi:MarR family transcriptional regulator [Salinisphaera sp. T5B8]|uniref:homoprotocatechuate degradation operon regulator HpaR n=1 Tax=unclassified Salinisphaera TaxID=2649847 RepID=UPI00333F4C77
MSQTSNPARQRHYKRHPLETRHALPMTLLRARESVMARFRPMLNAHGISEQQWRVMRVLAEEGVLDATEISGRACIFASSLSRIIKTLEKQGALVRERCADDARRVQLRLTDQGYRTVAEITPESVAIYRELEEKFGRERVATLIDMLNELVDME